MGIRIESIADLQILQDEFNEVKTTVKTKGQSIDQFIKIGFGEKELVALGLEWRKIKGFEKYKVSNLGSVKNSYGDILRLIQENESSSCLTVSLQNKNRNCTKRAVHKLSLFNFPLDIDRKRFFTVPQ